MKAEKLNLRLSEFLLVLGLQSKSQNYSFKLPYLVAIWVLRTELAEITPVNGGERFRSRSCICSNLHVPSGVYILFLKRK